jgi:hypothetical protein
MEKFNESLPVDKRMWAEDIQVRGAAGALGGCGWGRGNLEASESMGMAWSQVI